MPREAIDQIFNRAQQGDVTAMALVGQMLKVSIFRKNEPRQFTS